MGRSKSEEFRQEAVRIALTSGLTREQVASDLGIGLSTLNKWVTTHRDTGDFSTEDQELARENDRLRREIRILKEERDILRNSHGVLRDPKVMRFKFVEEHRKSFSITPLCQVMGVGTRGFRAFCKRPASQRQRTDMIVLAHIKEQSRLSLGAMRCTTGNCEVNAESGRPRMTEELKELGLNVGHRRCFACLPGRGWSPDAGERHLCEAYPQIQGHDRQHS